MIDYFVSLPDTDIKLTIKRFDGVDITSYIFSEDSLYDGIKEKYNRQKILLERAEAVKGYLGQISPLYATTSEVETAEKAKADAASRMTNKDTETINLNDVKEKMRNLKNVNNYTNEDIQSLVNINMQLIDIIANKLS